jgi:hypothetical protein
VEETAGGGFLLHDQEEQHPGSFDAGFVLPTINDGKTAGCYEMLGSL